MPLGNYSFSPLSYFLYLYSVALIYSLPLQSSKNSSDCLTILQSCSNNIVSLCCCLNFLLPNVSNSLLTVSYALGLMPLMLVSIAVLPSLATFISGSFSVSFISYYSVKITFFPQFLSSWPWYICLVHSIWKMVVSQRVLFCIWCSQMHYHAWWGYFAFCLLHL